MAAHRSLPRLRVAIVAPSTRILGGQAVQAARLLECWNGDEELQAWLVPVNPLPPAWLRWTTRVKYLRTLVTQLLYWPLLARELRRADVVHVFSASYFSFLLAPLPAVLIAMLLRRPVLLNYRSGEAPDHLRRSRIARAVLARVDRNLVPSSFLRDVFASFGLTAHVIPNIVDLDRFRFRLRSPFRPRLVSTRNFEPLYNVACTLRAFRRIQNEFPDASLTLVGAGSLDRELRALAVQLGLRNVLFLGRVAPADIWACYADADIYVQTPDIDNMPASVLEAAASGAVVVSTDAGGLAAMVTHEVDGLLVPKGDDRAVAQAVLRVLREPGLAERLASAARDRCAQYAWPRVRRDWLAAYQEVAECDRRRVSGSANSPGRLRGLVARLSAMDSRELRFRLRTFTLRAARRVMARVVRPAWDRRDLVARLDTGVPGLSPSLAALRDGNWEDAHRRLADYIRQRPSRFVLDQRARPQLTAAVKSRFPRAVDDAHARAEGVIAGRYDLLGYKGLEFPRHAPPADHAAGSIPDWHLDPVHRRRAGSAWWDTIDYLDPRHGDHKVIWELNRHQHWLALGRAYWLTGNQVYRDRFVVELEDWMQANPPLVGINWASMLELSLRSLSWLWALHFFLDAGSPARRSTIDSPWVVDLLLALDRQMRHVEENLSTYFSPNTHLTGEALGLYVVGRVLPEFRDAGRWEATGRAILLEEASRQIEADGGHAERSPHYHRYTLDFYLLALAVARASGDRAAELAFAPIVATLAKFAWALADASGELPHIGDDDGGQLMPICGGAAADVMGSLSIAATLLPDEVPADDVMEESFWAGRAYESQAQPRGQGRPSTDAWETSAAFESSGYCVSRTRSGDHLVVDAGPHGFLNGGHAHADALSLTLSVRWHRFLIDPGTGTYTIDPAIRDRFRSTAMHNTLLVDGRDQAEPDGPFHWRRATDARLTAWAANPRFDFFEGKHDGYAPVRHRRLVLALGGELWLIVDRVEAGDAGTGGVTRRAAAVHWHMDPAWQMRLEGPTLEAVHRDGLRVAVATTARRLDLFHGDNATGLGWCSPAYGQLVPCATVRFACENALPFAIATVIAPLTDAARLSVRQLPSDSSNHAGLAFRVTRDDEAHLVLLRSGSDEVAGNTLTCVGGFETDARMAHVRLTRAGDLTGGSLVDFTRLRRTREGAFALEADERVHELAFAIDPTGDVDLFAAGPLREVRLTVPGDAVRSVRINDKPVRFTTAGARAVVTPGRQPVAGDAGRPVVTLPVSRLED